MLNHSSFRAKPKRIVKLMCQINNDAKMIYIHLRMNAVNSVHLNWLALPSSEFEITFINLEIRV